MVRWLLQAGSEAAMKPSPLILTTLGLLILSGTASAQEIPCGDGPCLQRQKTAATHFLIELNGGGSPFGARGPVFGGVLGVGGSLRAIPFLRFYLVSELAYSQSSERGQAPALAQAFSDDRTHRDLAFGLRVYLVVRGPLRLFSDVTGGASYLTGSIERPDLPLRSASGWSPLAAVSTGVQIRFIHQLAVGVRVRFVLTGDELDGLRVAMGSESARPIALTAGLTWHF
jgi:hypothetical protein